MKAVGQDEFEDVKVPDAPSQGAPAQGGVTTPTIMK
jgi:hypothetical protein